MVAHCHCAFLLYKLYNNKTIERELCMENKMNPIWRVYRDDELRYLQSCGFRYELLAKDIRSDRKFYLFMNSDELQKVLKEFKEVREKLYERKS